ncbi:universal stress protein family protein [Microbacterium sp. SLBN-154]|uniref:universal stress protein n=1 Tax=Microbacterium sp. SLBN-154 TaxID=2768458 RepID=UPI00114F8297|nr:universal stress protein [Microbacterium sp. SLBN-154]TQK20710.1 universal stress protein family protein [Microbacterium sp. SLBN-154]
MRQQTIVVGLEPGVASTSLLDWVAARAERIPLRVHLVAVTRFGIDGSSDVEAETELAAAYLRSTSGDIAVDTHVVTGTMPEALMGYDTAADLVVLGIRRGDPLHTFLHGWMPVRAAARAVSPVVFIPTDGGRPDGPVVVGIDLETSDAAVLIAAREAELSGEPLVVVHVGADRGALDRACEQARNAAPGIEVRPEWVPRGDPVAVIQSVAADASLVVVGSHRRGPLSSALLGSVSVPSLWHLRAPVCLAAEHEA